MLSKQEKWKGGEGEQPVPNFWDQSSVKDQSDVWLLRSWLFQACNILVNKQIGEI